VSTVYCVVNCSWGCCARIWKCHQVPSLRERITSSKDSVKEHAPYTYTHPMPTSHTPDPANSRHINWATQHNTSSDAYLLPLIESAARRFTDDSRYTQDIRYVRMWISYTRLVERREEVWAFLESRGIGTNHAVFYEEWASACETLGR
jgi:hypothetical protein